MREIKRARFLRGTKAWVWRNWFVFGGLALTVAIGTASVVLFPGVRERLLQKTAQEKAAKLEWKKKIEAIQRHRQELEQATEQDRAD